MQLRIRHHIRQVVESFWFIPSLMTLAGLLAAAAGLRLDMVFAVQELAKENPLLFTSGEGARTLLATLAGSAISVAGVVFSITIVVLNMASTQFGPRLIGNFMHHKGTQVVLGAFVATFTYSLVVLRFVHDGGGFVPHISANFGFLLGLLSFFLLIYFIHHVSVFIQAARVIDDVAVKMEKSLRSGFPERRSRTEKTPDEEDDDSTVPSSGEHGAAVTADRPGYLQVIDLDKLVETACAHDIQILMKYRPGHFIIQDAIIAEVTPPEKLDARTVDAVRACLAFGPERSETQDPEFAVYQLVEVALRALSAGINDPFTAMNCLDRIAAALALLATRRLPSRYLRDANGALRVITDPLTYGGVVDAAFNQVRQSANGHVAVLFRMLEIVAELARREIPDAFRDALARQLRAIESGVSGGFNNEIDTQHYLERLANAEKAIVHGG